MKKGILSGCSIGN